MPPETTQDVDKRPLPALWNYLTRVYTAMEDEAEDQQLADDSDETGLVYEGHLTQLFQELGIPNPYYTSVMRALRTMQCVAQLRRGGGPAKSRWVMIAGPTEGAFIAFEATGNKTAGRHKGKAAATEQRIRDLTARVRRLEDIVYDFMEAKNGTEAVPASDSPAAGDGRKGPQDTTDAGSPG